ncbi:acylphosphatase [Dyella sp. SG562]|uniref:acylphosphatase n=1 Tax=Dyella TaxID=231454 RepID=UPI001422D6AB|nr:MULTISPECIES: acylphosphatase [unclassified Dyella]NII74418.1 acylphosphatase [Dyella sp. SG562]NKJ21207.1 acylphosphatase [Dyella sp. SG609]
MAAALFRVSGKVQGVCFRACTREQALVRGLAGYARNLPDGGVEVLACGSPVAIDALEQWLRKGPPAARVDEVARSEWNGEEPEDFRTG